MNLILFVFNALLFTDEDITTQQEQGQQRKNFLYRLLLEFEDSFVFLLFAVGVQVFLVNMVIGMMMIHIWKKNSNNMHNTNPGMYKHINITSR